MKEKQLPNTGNINIGKETGLNPCNSAFLQLCGQLANCLSIPIDSLVTVNDENNSINCLPLSANFGAKTETQISSIIKDCTNNKEDIDLPSIFEPLKSGLEYKLPDHQDRKKDEKRKKEIIFYNPEQMIGHLDFMIYMAETLGEDMFDVEGNLMVLLIDIGMAIKKIDINNEVAQINELGQIQFAPTINQETKIVIKKRAMLLKAQEKNPDALIMPDNERGTLYHIIIPIKGCLEDCLGRHLYLKDYWAELAQQGKPFQSKETEALNKLIGSGNRAMTKKRPSRGSRGPGRHLKKN